MTATNQKLRFTTGLKNENDKETDMNIGNIQHSIRCIVAVLYANIMHDTYLNLCKNFRKYVSYKGAIDNRIFYTIK